MTHRYGSRHRTARERFENSVTAIEHKFLSGQTPVRKRDLVDARYLLEYLSTLKYSTEGVIAGKADNDPDFRALHARVDELNCYMNRLYPLTGVLAPAEAEGYMYAREAEGAQ